MLVLASQSQYRAELLRRLNLPFSQLSPAIDESARADEAPDMLAARLARDKALAVAHRLASALASPVTTEQRRDTLMHTVPETVSAPTASVRAESMGADSNRAPQTTGSPKIIASDQVATLGSQRLSKPGSVARACDQLRLMSGQAVHFHTALCVLDASSGRQFEALDTTVVRMRVLSDAEVCRYVDADQPLDCAGSFKMEALGISLFASVESRDPTALIGLPMIALCDGLRSFGMPLP